MLMSDSPLWCHMSRLFVLQRLEHGAEAPSRSVQPPSRRHSEAAKYVRDLCRRQTFPLGQQQDLAVTSEAATRLVHECVSGVPWSRLLNGSLKLQTLLETGATPLDRL